MTFPPDATQTSGRQETPAQAQPGVLIADRYELIARVGDGGHGTVWRARDQLLRREVAVKEITLPPGLPPDERQQLCDRTLREAQATASLSHASVVRVFDVVTESGLPWIVMELLQARSLADIIANDGPMPPRVVAKIGLALTGALEAAHEANILHRDVKPGNVLISSDGRCVLSDFGAASAGASGTGHTTPGMVLGSAHYIAPERAVGGAAVPASDLFSLGVTLYAALEGRPPFDRGDTTATMHAVVHEPPEAPRRAGPLAPLLAGLLDKDPGRRFDLARTRSSLNTLLSGPLSPDGAGSALPVSGGPVSGIPGGFPPGPVSGGPVSGGPVSAAPASGGPAQNPMAPPPATASPGQPPPPGYGAAGDFGGPPPNTGGFAAGSVSPNGFEPNTGFTAPPGPDVQKPAKKPGNRTGMLLGAGIGVVVLALIVTVGIMLFSGNGEPPPDNAGNEEQSEPDETQPELQTYKDPSGRFTVDVPKDWKQVDANGVEFHSPDNDDVWIRFQIGDATDPKTFLEQSSSALDGGEFDKGSYAQKRSEATELSGTAGWVVEYTGTRQRDGVPRHGVWAAATIGDQNYQIYLSVPEDAFGDSQPVFDTALKSYKVA